MRLRDHFQVGAQPPFKLSAIASNIGNEQSGSLTEGHQEEGPSGKKSLEFPVLFDISDAVIVLSV